MLINGKGGICVNSQLVIQVLVEGPRCRSHQWLMSAQAHFMPNSISEELVCPIMVAFSCRRTSSHDELLMNINDVENIGYARGCGTEKNKLVCVRSELGSVPK